MNNDDPILIVDDSAIMRQTAKRRLSGIGYANVHIATNGLEAVQKIKERAAPGGEPMFKIIFLDRNMPELDGLSVLNILRKELNIQDTAVIMLTAYSDNDSIITSIECGATSYAIKPVTPQVIVEKMNYAIEWLDKQKKN